MGDREGSRLASLSVAAALVVGAMVFASSEPHFLDRQGLHQPRTGARSALEMEPHLVGDVASAEDGAGSSGAGAETFPMCFSAPGAEPTEGAWRTYTGGMDGSPARNEGWMLPDDPTFTHLDR